MKAAVVREFGQPLVIEDRPIPPVPPFVPGHEGVGLVHAIGDGVSGLDLGQRVAVPWLGYACGTCKDCLTGWETLCLQQLDTG
jgi:alcohol dehydrogenase, propanol-preferring